MRQSQPEDFEQFAPSRFDDKDPASVRPDWLTRADDTEPAEAAPPLGAPRAGSPRPAEPRPAAPRDPDAWTPIARGEAPSLAPSHEPDAWERTAPPSTERRGAPSADPDAWDGTVAAEIPRRIAAPADPESWEGAVARAERTTDGPSGTRVTSHRSAFDFGGLPAMITRVATSKPFLIVVLALGAVLAAMMFMPRDEQTTSIAAIRRHPERFEGRPVQVRGRVGEVFPVGGGYAFHLHQGRESIVVFTRSRVPVRREDLTVTGSLSIGTLDGKSRQAIFETPR